MRFVIIFWYYVFLAFVLLVSFLFVDFTAVALNAQLLFVLALIISIANPLLFVWIVGDGKRKWHFKSGDTSAELLAKQKKLETEIIRLHERDNKLGVASKEKIHFVSMMVHQLRTPLSAIKWTFHMIMNGELGPVTSDQRSFLEKGYDSSEKVIAVVNDWLNLDYLEANKKKYQFISTDIGGLIDSVVFEFNPRTREKDLTLTVEKSKDNPLLAEVDPIKFSMIMENLIDNAVKYTPAGGQIRIAVNNSKINDRDPAVEVIVADTGIGIPKAEQERLFQQFFRSSNAAVSAPRGSGLGLFIAKSLIEGHNGTINFESEEGKGTKFIITIPLKQKKV